MHVVLKRTLPMFYLNELQVNVSIFNFLNNVFYKMNISQHFSQYYILISHTDLIYIYKMYLTQICIFYLNKLNTCSTLKDCSTLIHVIYHTSNLKRDITLSDE